jgi:hypothetical protein
VTRLGEFSPIGQRFTLGSVLKITEVAKSFVLLFFHSTVYVSILTKKLVELQFGRLFRKPIWSPCIEVNYRLLAEMFEG